MADSKKTNESIAELDGVRITEIRIRNIPSGSNESSKLKAYTTVTFNGCFVIHNMKIINGQGGLFIAMPSRMTKEGQYKDIVHPIKSEFRKLLQDAVVKAYEDEMKKEEK